MTALFSLVIFAIPGAAMVRGRAKQIVRSWVIAMGVTIVVLIAGSPLPVQIRILIATSVPLAAVIAFMVHMCTNC